MGKSRTLKIYLVIGCLFLFFIIAGNTSVVSSLSNYIDSEEGEKVNTGIYNEDSRLFNRMVFLSNKTYSNRIGQEVVKIKDSNTDQEGKYNVTIIESDNSRNTVRIKNDLSKNLTETYILNSYESSLRGEDERNVSRDTIGFYYNVSNQSVTCAEKNDNLICQMNRKMNDEKLQVKIDVNAQYNNYLINSCQTVEERFKTYCGYMEKFPRY